MSITPRRPRLEQKAPGSGSPHSGPQTTRSTAALGYICDAVSRNMLQCSEESVANVSSYTGLATILIRHL